MSMDKEPRYKPKEEGFKEKIQDRMKMWLQLVSDSVLDDTTKALLKNRLTMLEEYKKHHWNISEAFNNTVINISNVTHNKGGEADSLFENIRDDIWDFYKEI